MKRIWVSALLLCFLTLGCAKGMPVPWTSVASSADGSKLVAVGDGYIHTSTDSGATWSKRDPWGYWTSVASSTDGSKLVAVSNGSIVHEDHGNIFVSTDFGVSWTQASVDESNWASVAASSNGSKLVVVGDGNSTYTSTDSGVSWTQHSSLSFSGDWASVASSADGSKLAAVVTRGPIYTSVNSGLTWTPLGTSNNWTAVASSADGTMLVAVAGGGFIYTSANSGTTWTQRSVSDNWTSVASSADGSKLVAVAGGGFIYTSTDFGATWTQGSVSDNWTSVASSADGSKLVALTSAGNIYTSTNSGGTWTKLGGTFSGNREAGARDAPVAQPDVSMGGKGGGAGGIGGNGGGGSSGLGGSGGADAARPDAPGAQPDVPKGGDTASSVGGAVDGGAGDVGVPDLRPDLRLGGSDGAGIADVSGTGGSNPFGTGGSGKGGAGGTLSSGGTGTSGGAGGSAGSTSAVPPNGLAVWVAQKTTGSTGQIGLNLRIDNKTAQSADMSAVTLRYWYQDEGLGTALSLSVMYASIGYSLQGRVILNKVVSVSPASPGADHYLELSFAGTLAAQGDASTNDRFSIQVTVHTLGYTGAVDVTNDYSYDGGAALLYEQKITLHDANGNVIWGVAPGTSPVGGADAAVDTSVSGDVGLPDIPYPQPDVPIAGTGGVPSTGGITTTGGATASGGTTSVGGTTTTDAATASGGSGGSNDASGSDDAATDGGNPPPSCSGLAATCGPSGNESCCTSLLVPGGTFFRSYDGVDFTDPNYPATVADFYLDKYEITVGRFRAFVNAGMGTQLNPPASGAGAHPLITGSGWDSTWNTSLSADTASLKAAMQCDLTYQTWTDTAGDNESMPVNCMNWYTAFAFCAWDGARLPTEAEWNYAAAGGSEQRYYPWSSPATSTTIDDSYAVYCGGSCTPQNVGSKSPTGDGKWGQSDLAGNLWEWMLDYYADPYPMPCDSCVASIAAFDRVARGGCFSDVASNLRSALRNNNDPSGHSFAFGARCARSSL
jgi:formylglycine-generating enzyme required for sulfatase activity/photosystem II stability/assembly factor-like uncharacterized protein